MLDKIYANETRNTADGSELLDNKLSEEEKGRILDMALYKMKSEKADDGRSEICGAEAAGTKKTTWKRRRILIAALAAVFAFATTAFAAEVFQWDVRISNYFGINEKNSEELAKGAQTVGVSTEQNGMKVEAVQTLGDAKNMYILLDVTAPEGTAISPESRFDMIYLKVDGATSLGYSCDILPDESENDNKATLLFSMEANKNINNKLIDLRFHDLEHYDAKSDKDTLDVKGDWELKWKLDYQDSSVEFPIDKKLTVNGETVTIDSVSISPIAVSVNASGKYIAEYDSQPPDPEAGDLIQITAITMKDGTVLRQKDAEGWGASNDGGRYVINMKMKKLLDPEQIESITLNDTKFLIK